MDFTEMTVDWTMASNSQSDQLKWLILIGQCHVLIKSSECSDKSISMILPVVALLLVFVLQIANNAVDAVEVTETKTLTGFQMGMRPPPIQVTDTVFLRSTQLSSVTQEVYHTSTWIKDEVRRLTDYTTQTNSTTTTQLDPQAFTVSVTSVSTSSTTSTSSSVKLATQIRQSATTSTSITVIRPSEWMDLASLDVSCNRRRQTTTIGGVSTTTVIGSTIRSEATGDDDLSFRSTDSYGIVHSLQSLLYWVFCTNKLACIIDRNTDCLTNQISPCLDCDWIFRILIGQYS